MKSIKLAFSIMVAGVAAALLSFTPMMAMAAGTQAKNPLSIPKPASHQGQMSQNARVNINQASATQLQKVGISHKVAENIVAYRNQHGPFKNTKDLTNVKGVTPQMVHKINGKITVGNTGTGKSSSKW